MKFRVRIEKTELATLNGQPAVRVRAVSIDGPGEVVVTVPMGQAGDYKAGDVVIAEVRTKRTEDA